MATFQEILVFPFMVALVTIEHRGKNKAGQVVSGCWTCMQTNNFAKPLTKNLYVDLRRRKFHVFHSRKKQATNAKQYKICKRL